MIVYRGMASYRADEVLRDGEAARLHGHLDRPACCCTTDFDIAVMFAIRKTPMVDFDRITGKVIEFELTGDDWEMVRDPRAILVDESEIAVYDVSLLTPVATWSAGDDGEWRRNPCLQGAT